MRVATLMAYNRRRCDKLCYGSSHDGKHCKCVCGGKCHGQGKLRATEIVRTEFYPEWEGAPGWRFNMPELNQGVLEAARVAGGEVHRLVVKETYGGRGFVARCSCGKLAGRAGRAVSRDGYGQAQRAAQREFDRHIKDTRAGSK